MHDLGTLGGSIGSPAPSMPPATLWGRPVSPATQALVMYSSIEGSMVDLNSLIDPDSDFVPYVMYICDRDH